MYKIQTKVMNFNFLKIKYINYLVHFYLISIATQSKYNLCIFNANVIHKCTFDISHRFLKFIKNHFVLKVKLEITNDSDPLF